MAESTVEGIIEEVRTLSRDEQEKVRDAIEALLAEPRSLSPEEEVARRLFERGLLSEIKPRRTDPRAYRERKLVTVKGKPISEVIIEERR